MNNSNNKYLFLLNGIVILGFSVLDFELRDSLLIALMLFLPFIDKGWGIQKSKPYKHQWMVWSVFIGVVVFIVVTNPHGFGFIVFTVLLVALPEEWFFRGYFLIKAESVAGNKWVANIITSILFTILHMPTQGLYGLTVFVPSMILGWFYQQRRDIVLVILLHALSNLVYLLYVREVVVSMSDY